MDVCTVTLSGQQPPLYLQINLTVHNYGLSTATQSLVNVLVSSDPFASPDDYVWLGGVPIPLLPPGQLYSTGIPVGLPPLPLGAYCMVAQCDAASQVVEGNENNNIVYTGPVLVGSDVVVDFFTYNELNALPVPLLGSYFSEPLSSVEVAVRVVNRGLVPVNNAFWLEFWGSRKGGLVLDEFLANSRVVPGVYALSSFDLLDVIQLYSVPDGPYTVVGVVDRTEAVTEVYENNNRTPVSGKRLLELRPPRGMNLHLQQFRFAPNPVGRGDWLKFSGSVINDGAEYSGPFWIEFWATRSKGLLTLDFPICDSVRVDTLRPGQQVFLLPYQRTLYSNIPAGTYSIICVVDRPDNIAENDESDNFIVSRNVIVF